MTSSIHGTFYFAYGSNLSPEQMAGRCIEAPEVSAEPVAIARMDGWKWFICQRGYANIAPCQPQHQPRGEFQPPIPAAKPHQSQSQSRSRSPSPPKQSTEARSRSPTPPKAAYHTSPNPQPSSWRPGAEGNHENVVWGIVYNLTSADEANLDSYEGYSKLRYPPLKPNPSPEPANLARKPMLQGTNDYNKLYLAARVIKWLQPPQRYGIADEYSTEITVLAYVDEMRTGEGRVKPNYVGRMNRAIEQSVPLGIPPAWVERVMRKWITPGPRAPKGYLGGKADDMASLVSSRSSISSSPSPGPESDLAQAQGQGQGRASEGAERAASMERPKKRMKESTHKK